MAQCLFNEPWIGQCKETAVDGDIVCEKHLKEKCQVCLGQALTRCQASIGVMCGVPLCHLCGAGEMCLDHAGRGPLVAIRTLLGGGPVAGVFSTRESISNDIAEAEAIEAHLRKKTFYKRTMAEAKEAVAKMQDQLS